MSRHQRSLASPRLALLLGLAVALAPALALAGSPALAQGQASNGQADGTEQGNDSERGANDSDGPPSNGSGQDDRQAGDGQRGDDRDRGGDRGPPGQPGRAPPVEIRDRPGGFATRAPPDSPRPEVAVDASNASVTVERPDVAPMKVHLDVIVEFTDEDGDGGYDLAEPVVNRTTLSEVPSRVVADDANETRTLVYELGEGGELRLVFDLGTTRAEQVGAKFDVVVDGYPFESNDTRIALGSRVQVDGGLERVERGGHPAVVGQDGEQAAYLSWVPHVQVDGVNETVADSVHVDAEEPSESAIVYWAYPQGERIVHDPELGVRDVVRDLAGQLAPFALGLAATTTVLFAGYLVRARWPP